MDQGMMTPRLEKRLQTTEQQGMICKYGIILCVCIFTLLITLSYYYCPDGQSDGRKGVYMLLDHSAEMSSPTAIAELGSVLEKASMPNKTVIITPINAAWAEEKSILDLYLQSFRIGEGTQQLLNHVLLVAVDEQAFKRCQQIHPHCYFLLKQGPNFSGERVFMTQEYLDLMWARILFLKHVLALGYSFVFSDADVLWFRNPFQLFDEKADFQIACDHYTGDPHNLSNDANGGFNFARSSNKSIKFYEWWYESRASYLNLHDQAVLNNIKSGSYLSEIGLKMVFLDTKYISGFCEQRASLNDVFTMHANCCVGMKNKIADLTLTLDDWAYFRALNGSLTTVVDWRAPESCLSSGLTT